MRQRPRRRLGRRGILLIVVVIVLAALGGVIAVVWLGGGSKPVSTEEAEERFHEGRTTGPQPGSRLRPAEGVYTYRGSGTEHISVPPKSQDQGPVMPATVTHGRDGCWTFRIDYSTNHWQDWIYCSKNGRLEEHGGQTFQRWDFVVTSIESVSKFTCDPPAIAIKPAMKPGQTWRQSCEGTTTDVEGVGVSSGTYRFVGLEQVKVAQHRVDAYHFVQERTLKGAQTGSQRADLWFGTDGLPLRNERQVKVDTDTAVGAVTYTEEGVFQLAELRPKT